MVGWAIGSMTGDRADCTEYWFDPDSHLLVEVVHRELGLPARGEWDYRFEWKLNPHLEPGFFTPKPLRAATAASPPNRVRTPIGLGRVDGATCRFA